MAENKQPVPQSPQRDYVSVLHCLVKSTATEHRQQVILDTALDCILDGVAGFGAVVFLSQDLDQTISLASSSGIRAPRRDATESTFGPSLMTSIHTAALNGVANQVTNHKDSAFPSGFKEFSHFACTPLNVENRNLGALGIFFPSTSPPNKHDLSFLDLAGDFLAMKVDFAYTSVVQLAIDEELLRNERYLECLSGISSSLLGVPEPMKELPSILGWLRQVTGACRCSFFSTTYDENGDCVSSIKHESRADGVPTHLDDPNYANVHLVEAGLSRWIGLFESGNEVVGTLASLPEQDTDFMQSTDATWLLILPVTALGVWVGSLCFEVTGKKPYLGDQEVALLRSVANALSSALERKAGIEELEDARNHLENILQATTTNAIVATDLEFNVIHISSLAEDLFGYSRQDIVGQTLEQCNIFEDTQLDELQKVIDIVKDDGSWAEDMEIIDPSGKQVILNALVSGMYTKGGKHYGYTFFLRDVTLQRLQERQLVERQRMESVGMLAGGIAHDFNNILMGILGYASLAKDRIDQEHVAHRMVSTIEKSAERAASLTRELLAYARGGKSQSVNVQLNDQTEEILSILATNIPKGVVIEKNFARKLPWLLVDPAQLQQVIMNLCLNAGDAVSERLSQDDNQALVGVIKISTFTIDITSELAGLHGIENFTEGIRYVCMEVSDNGTGMDEATKRKIFEPFFTTKITGRGLGLAAVEGIIRNHGGCLIVDSELDKGSTFTIMLPEDLDCQIEDSIDELGQLGGSETILVIDDEEINRQLALLTLTNLGHSVLLAENGREGLDVLQKHAEEIELILLDLTMPGMKIEAMLQELERIHNKVPIILTSGFDKTKLAETKGTQIAAAFLQKPYAPEVLARAVRKVLDMGT